MLLKKGTHIILIDWVEGSSSNPVWRKTLSLIKYKGQKFPLNQLLKVINSSLLIKVNRFIF